MLRPYITISLLLITSINTLLEGDMGLITGRALDMKGNPIQGATIIVEGTSLGDMTDTTGTFEITIEPGVYTLLLRRVGRIDKDITNIEVINDDTCVVLFDSLCRQYPEYQFHRYHGTKR